MPLIYVPSAKPASTSGIFIPRDNVIGLVSDSELADSVETIKKDCKFLAGFLTTLQYTIAVNRATTNSIPTALGFTVTKGNPVGDDLGTFTQSFTASVAQIVDYSTSTFYPIPVPTTGSNSGRGVLKITDVFPDAVSVASAGAIAEAGILIPHSEIDAYGAVTATNPTNDTQSRQWFAAMLRYLFDLVSIRINNTNTEIFSALITKSLGTVNLFTLPADALATTNPLTGLGPTKVSVNDIYFRSLSFNIQYFLNETTQTFGVQTSLNPISDTNINLWSPQTISTLLWLDASDLTNATINFWADKSGNNRHFSLIEDFVNRRPSLLANVINGKNAVKFDASNQQYLQTNNFPQTGYNNLIIAAVVKWETVGFSASDIQTIIDNNHGSSPQEQGFAWQDRPDLPNRPLTVFRLPIATPSFAGAVDIATTGDNNWKIITSRFSLNQDSFSVNGRAERINTNNGIFNIKPDFRIGGSINFGRWFNGEIAELVITTEDKLTELQGYLAWKYNLQSNLSNEHPFKNQAP